MSSSTATGSRSLTVLLSATFFVCSAAALARPSATFPLAPPPPGPPVAIVGASLVDVVNGVVVPNAVVVINGDRIAASGPAAAVSIPDGARLIRLDGQYLIPGLINAHVHLGNKLPGAAGAALANETVAEQALRMAGAAKKSLESGVTTVRITGGDNQNDFALKRSINAGHVLGPRIEAAGELVVPTGGHGNREADGPAALSQAAREQIKHGATWIKTAISGGIADSQGDIAASPMLREELVALIEVAHRNNIKITAHNGSPIAADAAIELGVDCFEHGYFLGRKQLLAMKAKGVWLVPTIGVSQAAALEFFKRQGMPPWYMERVKSVSTSHWAMLQEAIKIGVNIALGTDQDPHEPNEGTTTTVREAEYYVQAGMTPLAALRSATSEAARMLNLSKDIGSLEAGRFADVVATKQNPLTDISALRGIRFVMKGGQVVRQDAL
jgi:imidazolonepropionase-like amidohydrolase